MKIIRAPLVVCILWLPLAMFAQSTQVLQNLLQAQTSNATFKKFIVVDASDTGLFRAKYNDQVFFIDSFQTIRVGCTSLGQNQNLLCWAIIESSISLVSEESLIYETPFFEINKHDTIGVSHLFYVKIPSKADTVSLKSLALDQNVDIIGYNQHMPLWYTLSCTKNSKGDALKMAFVFRSSGLFEKCEPDLLVGGRVDNPNDPYFPYQWGMFNVGQDNGIPGVDINVLKAQKITTGNSNITVAVIDQGFELNHPDLGSISPYSYDTEFDNSPSKIWGNHGTACAGIIGATTNNNVGIAGIAPNSPLISISNLLTTLMPDENQKLANGINQAWKHNAAVISNSWHYPYDSCAFISDAIDSAVVLGRSGKGCVVVFSAGNNNDTVNYPACKSNVIAVGAVDRCGVRSGIELIIPEACEHWHPTGKPGSAFGDKLNVVAPGTHIYTTDRQGTNGYNQMEGVSGNYYEFFEGTSAACPHVAGIAALMLSVNSDLTSKEVQDIVEQTVQKTREDLYHYVDTIGHPNGKWNKYMGYGLVDAHRAVLKAAFHKIYGEHTLSVCDTNVRTFTVRAPHNANIDSVSFFWTCSDNLQMVAGQTTDSVWVKRINSGAAQLSCHIIHDGDTVTTTLEIPVLSERTVYDNVSLSGGYSFPDTFVLSREIVIDSLSSLTWQNRTILCTPDCRIIVRPGGFLTLDHTTLTSACPNRMWQGIEVAGNSGLPQILHNNGILYIENGSVIENAYTAVRNCLATDNVYVTTGGVVQASSSTFRNNRRAVEFNSYAYSSNPELIPNYISSFKQCTFTVNDQNLFAANDTVFTEHVKLWEVRGVPFRGCGFYDSTSTPVSGRRGVFTEDAGIILDTYCDFAYSGCECPESHSTYSSFFGFTTGVEVNTTGFQFPVTVNQVRFSNNCTGVRVNGNLFATVTRNIFNLNNSPLTTIYSVGLDLNNSTGYSVEENTFHKDYNYSTAIAQGIKVRNSTTASNKVYRNSFQGLDYGIYVSGTNGGYLKGLQILCNNFSGNGTDIYIAPRSTVSPNQGNANSSAGNTFDKKVGMDIVNDRSQNINYYYTGNISGVYYPDQCSGLVTRLSASSANTCASLLCENGGNGRSLAGFLSNIEADTYYIVVRALMSDTALDLNELEQWHTAAQHIADPYSLTETRFMEGYAEPFVAYAEDAEMTNYADFHAMKLALRIIDGVETQNFASLQSGGHVNWYTLTPAQIAQLQTIAERNAGRASVMAKGVLCFFFDICYDDEDVSSETDSSTETRAKHTTTGTPNDATLTVYPNPTNDLLFVELSGAEIANIVLYDLQGRVVETLRATSLQGATTTINLKSVPAGVYVLRVTDENNHTYHQRIIKE